MESAERPGRRVVAARARELLSERIRPVEELAARLQEYHDAVAAQAAAQQRVAARAEAAREAYETCRGAGWSAAELRRLDLDPPPAPRRLRGPALEVPAGEAGAGDAGRSGGDAVIGDSG